ncbi:hypothetical protein BJY01DRAFT_209501 [Aspergillus pseudoustus]|uniref:Uncharacterized protein n=1 Tax=Aspergillus pseudoustus TaxID=1810923 RepID=A0ABR4KFH5_9EURO
MERHDDLFDFIAAEGVMFDLAELQPLPVHLDLAILAAQIIHGAVLVVPNQVASFIHAGRGRRCRCK